MIFQHNAVDIEIFSNFADVILSAYGLTTCV